MDELIKGYRVKDFTINKYESLDSTMRLTRLGDVNEVTFTELQTAGRGKGSRTWEGKKGNLFFSIKLQPNKNFKDVFQLSFLSAVAVRRAIKTLDKDDKLNVSLKWPNDVLVNGKKVCGLLLESDVASYQKNNNEFGKIIVGIGVNIKHSPETAIYTASNLLESGIKATAEEFLNIFLEEFGAIYKKWQEEGFEFIRKEWLSVAHNLGQEVKFKINDSDEMQSGIFQELNKNGEMVTEMPDGSIKLISSADIFN